MSLPIYCCSVEKNFDNFSFYGHCGFFFLKDCRTLQPRRTPSEGNRCSISSVEGEWTKRKEESDKTLAARAPLWSNLPQCNKRREKMMDFCFRSEEEKDELNTTWIQPPVDAHLSFIRVRSDVFHRESETTNTYDFIFAMFTRDVDYLISDCQHQDVKVSVLFNVARNIWREEFKPTGIQMSWADVRRTEDWLIFSASEGNVLPSGAPCHRDFLISFSFVILLLLLWRKPEVRGGSGRASSVCQSTKVNNTQHALRGGKCGNARWKVKQRKLRCGEQRGLGGVQGAARELAAWAGLAALRMIQREVVLTVGDLWSVKETKWQVRCTLTSPLTLRYGLKSWRARIFTSLHHKD